MEAEEEAEEVVAEAGAEAEEAEEVVLEVCAEMERTKRG